MPGCLAQVERLRTTADLRSSSDRARRAQTVARTRVEPVLFVREPTFQEHTSAAALRRTLPQFGSAALRAFFRSVRGHPELARAVLLREGYFYVEYPEAASLLVDAIELRHLFVEPELVLERGSERLRLNRNEEGEYVYAEGPNYGTRAKLWLYDRVWQSGADPGPPLHRDLASLQRTLHFDEAELERAHESHALLNLRYGTVWVSAVVAAQGPNLSVVCEALGPEERARVAEMRERGERRFRAIEQLRRAIAAQVDEGLPFDEPKTEEGQQDGKLRAEWRLAYRQGKSWFEFNEDRYYVFDRKGRPRVPQVCIDFITDTLERASGTWWQAQPEARTKQIGRLDFSNLGIENRRSVETFVAFAWDRPDLFDVFDLPATEQIPFRRRARFFEHLYEHRDRYAPGDVVVILGLRDDEKYHYHSFFVHSADPVTGMPMLVASNAGRPRVRSWEHELRNAPKRSIRTRIRPRLEWLEQVLEPGRSARVVPPVGASGSG